MGRGGKHLAWVVAACVAVCAQAVPRSLCLACDQPCCAERAAGRIAAPTASEPVGGCPRCAAATVDRPAEPNERPCRCALEARHDEQFATSRSTLVTVAGGENAAALPTAPPIVPQVLGVSREYLAASLAVPIRPPRILFGVWRN